jgi:hypothetical protein
MERKKKLAIRMQVKRIILLDFHVSQDWYGLQLHVEIMPMWIVCLHLVIFCSEQVPRNSTLKSRYFRFFRKKKCPKLIRNEKSARVCSVDPDDHLVVEPFYKTMELWHV